MRRFAVVTALTAALALAALATDADARPPRGIAADASESVYVLASVADAGDSTARQSQTAAANGGGGHSNVENYQMSVRRTRRAATALACVVAVALLLIAFAIRRRYVRARTN